MDVRGGTEWKGACVRGAVRSLQVFFAAWLDCGCVICMAPDLLCGFLYKSELGSDSGPQGGGGLRGLGWWKRFTDDIIWWTSSPPRPVIDELQVPCHNYAHTHTHTHTNTHTHSLTEGCKAVDISNGWAFVLPAASGVNDTRGRSRYERTEKGR